MESESHNGGRKEIRISFPAPHAKQKLTRPSQRLAIRMLFAAFARQTATGHRSCTQRQYDIISSFFSNRTSGRRSRRHAADQSNGSSTFASDPRQSVENLSTTYTENPTAGAIAVHTSGYTVTIPDSSTGTQQRSQLQPHPKEGHCARSSMNSSDSPPWLVPFDEVGFRSKWLKCQYDADELQNLIFSYFDIWIKDLRPESEWAGYEAALKKAYNFGQSKVPEYKAKGCDDAVRVFQEAHSNTIN
jgi:hypothetical protein